MLDTQTLRHLAIAASLGAAATASAGDLYARAGSVADIPPGDHDAQGVVTIIDERTLLVEHFTYDGTAPAVYFYLGESDTHTAFLNGLQLMPMLDRPYDDETLTLTLPEGESMDDYNAISVWCAAFGVNFSSASFEAPAMPYARVGWVADMAPGAHDAEGEVTIITDRILHVERFTYDGTAPAVYFYLGESDTYTAFLNGLQLMPHLDRAYSDESLVVTLPDGETMDGYHAISVWCAAVSASFTSAPFVAPALPCPSDVNGDAVVDVLDLLAIIAAWGSAGGPEDVTADGFVDVLDLLAVIAAWGPCGD